MLADAHDQRDGEPRGRRPTTRQEPPAAGCRFRDAIRAAYAGRAANHCITPGNPRGSRATAMTKLTTGSFPRRPRADVHGARRGEEPGRRRRAIREAARQGAQYVQTPEITTLMEMERERLFAAMRAEEGNAAIAYFRALARELGIWLHVGSMGILVGNGKVAARQLDVEHVDLVEARLDGARRERTAASGWRPCRCRAGRPSSRCAARCRARGPAR